MKLILPPSVSSPQDLEALLVDVRSYARWYAHDATKKRLSIRRASERPPVTRATDELLRDWTALKPLSVQSLDELIHALETFRQQAPVLTITLAAPPSAAVKSALVDWCRKNLEHDMLVSFSFNATLCGGVVVQDGSRIFDWSFRRQLLEARSRFPEVLRHV